MLAFILRLKELAIIVAGLNAASAPPPAKTKKSVRIESPTETIPPHPAFHNADESFPRRMSYTHYAGSPPPVSPAGFSHNLEDTERVISGKREETGVRGIAGGSRNNLNAPEVVQSPSSAPANPFSKTLATIEPHERGSEESAGQNRGALMWMSCMYHFLGTGRRGMDR